MTDSTQKPEYSALFSEGSDEAEIVHEGNVELKIVGTIHFWELFGLKSDLNKNFLPSTYDDLLAEDKKREVKALREAAVEKIQTADITARTFADTLVRLLNSPDQDIRVTAPTWKYMRDSSSLDILKVVRSDGTRRVEFASIYGESEPGAYNRTNFIGETRKVMPKLLQTMSDLDSLQPSRREFSPAESSEKPNGPR